jgi:hypothetical protein
MRQRAHWGAIDPAIVGADVARLIAEFEQRRARPEAA